MFRKSAVLFVSLLAVVALSIAGCGEQQLLTDDELCQAVFDAIQSGDGDAFAALLITDENVKELVDGLNEADPKEKSIKDEFAAGFTAELVKTESMGAFDKLIEKAKLENLDLTQATYSGVLSDETRYEASNHQCRSLEFGIAIGEDNYYIRVDFFQIEASRYVYNLMNYRKLEK